MGIATIDRLPPMLILRPIHLEFLSVQAYNQYQAQESDIMEANIRWQTALKEAFMKRLEGIPDNRYQASKDKLLELLHLCEYGLGCPHHSIWMKAYTEFSYAFGETIQNSMNDANIRLAEIEQLEHRLIQAIDTAHNLHWYNPYSKLPGNAVKVNNNNSNSSIRSNKNKGHVLTFVKLFDALEAFDPMIALEAIRQQNRPQYVSTSTKDQSFQFAWQVNKMTPDDRKQYYDMRKEVLARNAHESKFDPKSRYLKFLGSTYVPTIDEMIWETFSSTDWHNFVNEVWAIDNVSTRHERINAKKIEMASNYIYDEICQKHLRHLFCDEAFSSDFTHWGFDNHRQWNFYLSSGMVQEGPIDLRDAILERIEQLLFLHRMQDSSHRGHSKY